MAPPQWHLVVFCLYLALRLRRLQFSCVILKAHLLLISLAFALSLSAAGSARSVTLSQSYRLSPNFSFDLQSTNVPAGDRPDRYRQSWLENIPFTRLSLDEGLSQSVVSDILQDSQGFMWLGTQDGLNRYDGRNFVTYKYNPDDPLSLGSSFIQAIVEDRDGVLWVGTLGGGLNQFNRDSGSFTRYLSRPEPNSLSDNNVLEILEARDGSLWIGTNAGGLNHFSKSSRQFTSYRYDPDDPESLSNDNINKIIEDEQGILWISTFGGGLNRFDPVSRKFTSYLNDPELPDSLSSNLAQYVYQDRRGVIWVGTFNAGLNRFEPETETFTGLPQ